MASAFGARLRRLREAKNLTLQQVADAVGCTKAYIWELEMKDGQRPSAERIQKIAQVLGVTMEDVMGTPMQQAPEASPRTWPSSVSTPGWPMRRRIVTGRRSRSCSPIRATAGTDD